MDIPSLFMIPSAVSSGKVHSVFPNSTDADFDFNRDSDATRVNSEGLIERVGYYGSELVTNGSFDTDSNWIKGTGWSIANGKANSNGTINQSLVQNGVFTISKKYKITFTVSNVNGTLNGRIWMATGGPQFNFSNAGTYTIDWTADQTNLYITTLSTNTASYSIDNISVVEVTGDRARLNYEIEGGLVNTKPSLLLEPQSTNLIKYSNDFTQSEWNKISGATVDANVIISPDGTLNASRLNFNTVSGSRMEDQIASASSGDYSFAVYLKADEPKTIGIRTGFAGTPTVNVNVTTEWQRFSITQNNPTNPANGYAQIRSIDASGGSVYVWGAQIEQLSYSTSFIPTNGSTQTRAAETCRGAGTSSIFNDSEGVLFAELKNIANDGTNKCISISAGLSASERVTIVLGTGDNIIRPMVKAGGVSVFDATTSSYNTINNFVKIAVRYKANNFACWVNGTQVLTDTSGAIPTGLDTLKFDIGNNTLHFYGKVRDIRVYNTKEMTDSEVDILLTKITS